jgi:hypothetical protein
MNRFKVGRKPDPKRTSLNRWHTGVGIRLSGEHCANPFRRPRSRAAFAAWAAAQRRMPIEVPEPDDHPDSGELTSKNEA